MFFEKFLLPDVELQLEIRSAEIAILPRENAVFYKNDIFALKWALMENMKKTAKNRFEIKLFFHIVFLEFEANLDRFWPPSWPPQNRSKLLFVPSCGQEASKRRPRGVQEAKGRLNGFLDPPSGFQDRFGTHFGCLLYTSPSPRDS